MKLFCIIFIILLTSVLASCETQHVVYTSSEEFWEGSDGLNFLFVEENPPEIVYEDTPFIVAIEMDNTGAHTLSGFLTLSLEDDYVCLVDENNECSTFNAVDQLSLSVKSDIDDYIVAIEEYTTQLSQTSDADTQQELKEKIQTARENIERLKDSVAVANPYKTKWFSLEGKSIFNYQGGIMTLSYPAKAKSAGTMSEKHDIDFVATACYEYTTKWNQDVCIDTDVNKMNIFPGACEATDISLSGQGAPLVITRIESTMLPTGTGYIRPMFTIYVDNSGNGKVINKEKIQHACTATGLESRDYNMVFLKSFMLSSEELSYTFNGYDTDTGKELNPDDEDLIQCSPNPLILENDGEDYIRCIVTEDLEWDQFSMNQAPYSTQLSVQFDYGYTLSKSQEMTIEKILTY
ncbi:MAG: hypothetical protein AABX98_03045 [Nanoarchaeota archaeon]